MKTYSKKWYKAFAIFMGISPQLVGDPLYAGLYLLLFSAGVTGWTLMAARRDHPY